jgi:hypothetical protein
MPSAKTPAKQSEAPHERCAVEFSFSGHGLPCAAAGTERRRRAPTTYSSIFFPLRFSK